MKDTRIFLIPNLDKSGSAEYTAQIINKLDSLGFLCFADDYNRGNFEGGKTEFLPFDKVIDQMDMVITIGGDGTIIRSCKRVMPHGKPMLGINCGRLGFLADIEVNQLDLLEHLATGEYSVQPRMMLRAVVRRGEVSQIFYALNDFSVTKGEFAKLVDLEVFCNQNMSAGGPIVDIGLDTIGLTPICPHTLFSKTILFSPSNVLEVHSKEINNSANVVFSVDGERMMNLTSQDFVEVSRADKTMDFINLTHNNFCDMLNAKMLERG